MHRARSPLLQTLVNVCSYVHVCVACCHLEAVHIINIMHNPTVVEFQFWGELLSAASGSLLPWADVMPHLGGHVCHLPPKTASEVM